MRLVDRQRRALWVAIVALAAWLGHASLHAGESDTSGSVPTRAGSAPATATSQALTTTQSYLGPDVVVLKELAALYEPVPFDHKGHARMAEMSGGCVTCHHRSPEQPTTVPATGPGSELSAALGPVAHPAQADSAQVPACKSCHAKEVVSVDLRVPGLKGAYHRQCLNCHREWMHVNACVICHKPRNDHRTGPELLTPDDIVGRMHPPIPEPQSKVYRARFDPADGSNVLFRHQEHVQSYGLTCATCHHRDSCGHCHDPQADTAKMKPLRPGKTWQESHGPCMSCHQQDRCRHCHYQDGQEPPPAFAHRSTGQVLDEKHATLKCGQCHERFKSAATLRCGDAACHPKQPAIAFPTHRPGPTVTTRPALAVEVTRPTTRPSTQATIRKIRAGNSQ